MMRIEKARSWRNIALLMAVVAAPLLLWRNALTALTLTSSNVGPPCQPQGGHPQSTTPDLVSRPTELLQNISDASTQFPPLAAQSRPQQETEPPQIIDASNRLPLLSTLTRSKQGTDKSCSNSQLSAIFDKVLDANRTIESKNRIIPLIIHQTSRTRCLAPQFKKVADEWRNLEGFEYYFHDDDAVDEFILKYDHPDFPHLPLIYRNCINSGATKADIWRLLILWEYGGVYADIDSAPNIFKQTSFGANDESFFLLDKDKCPSQYFMAVKPRHPLIYITLQSALSALMQVEDIGKYNPVQLTGPAMLRGALVAFCKWGGHQTPLAATNKKKAPQIVAGIYKGVHGATVRIVGVAGNPDTVVIREKVTRNQKSGAYRAMNMTHFKEHIKKESGESCQTAIMRESIERTRRETM